MKVCSKCNIEKEDSCFRLKKKDCKYILYSICKECERKCKLEYNEKHRKENNEYSKKYRQEHLEEIKEREKKYRDNNSKKIKEYNKEYYLKNKEKEKQRTKKYKQEHNIEAREYARKYQSNRKKVDAVYNYKCHIRSFICNCFKRKSFIKYEKMEKIIGVNKDFAWEYLKFTWYINYGYEWNGEPFHIDHIIPLSIAKNEEDVLLLCNITNLQMLKPIDNLKKGDKI